MNSAIQFLATTQQTFTHYEDMKSNVKMYRVRLEKHNPTKILLFSQ